MSQLMLALSAPAGHSGRSLTTTYETIAYHLHCSSSRLWLDDVMRQQEGIGHDDVQLHRRHFQEGAGKERDDKEVGDDHQEEHEKEDGRGRLAGCFSSSVARTLIAGFAARSRRAQHFGEGVTDRSSPSPNLVWPYPWRDKALITSGR
jgi:hypothetical protein